MALDTALALAFAPLLLVQAALTVRRAERLPEPVGPRAGRIGRGAPLRLLVLGDSSAAGVGVDVQERALAPQLAASLADTYRVDWVLCAQNGATTADAPRLLTPVAGQKFDVAYVIFGVNDTKNLRAATAWQRDYKALLTRLHEAHNVRLTFASGLPPMGAFPVIPRPLRTVLGMRAARFDRILQRLAADQPTCVHLPLPADLAPTDMARDGFHPGAAIYAHWAQGAADAMRAHLLQMPCPVHP